MVARRIAYKRSNSALSKSSSTHNDSELSPQLKSSLSVQSEAKVRLRPAALSESSISLLQGSPPAFDPATFPLSPSFLKKDPSPSNLQLMASPTSSIYSSGPSLPTPHINSPSSSPTPHSPRRLEPAFVSAPHTPEEVRASPSSGVADDDTRIPRSVDDDGMHSNDHRDSERTEVSRMSLSPGVLAMQRKLMAASQPQDSISSDVTSPVRRSRRPEASQVLVTPPAIQPRVTSQVRVKRSLHNLKGVSPSGGAAGSK